ncbi:variant erythrocyte surface antigen-1 family protein [Babesia caballi]|uniref:Variant erythrocyte surface antigen-1 family protein n=1 Tax=Babesia caballi TaxID=5871 RepID=A0AAV4LSS2_BABCB|nr:variant erythrocyte surface antigen-1 family protein [Babesia caballi]
MSDCPDVPEPKNLKDVLDLFEVLSASQLEEIVGKELDGRVKDFFSLKDVPKSVSGYRSISQNFYNVIHELREIRKVIVQNTAQDTYGIYSILASSNVDATCAKHCANRILTILPRLYTTLLFLKFQVEDNHSLGGGTWEEQQCGGGEDSASGKDALSHWLKSLQTGLHSAQHSESLRSETSPTLLPGGYEGDLSNTLGGEFVTPLSNLITDSGEDEGYLQYFLLDLVVITEYSHCNLATCLVVVRALCKTYTSSFQNQGQVISDPESVLKSIATKLKALAPEEADGDVSNALLTALFDGSPSKYSEHLKAAYFEGHMKWLSSIFDELTASLKLLGEESMKWDKAGLTNAKIAGPFGYGFSFSEQWKGEWKDDVAKTKIPDAIQTLTSGLEELKTILEQSNTSAVSRTSGSTGYTSAITRTPGSSEPGSDNPCTLESSGTVTEVPVPKNLKEAIDWVLRVSNKDGQGCDGDKGIEGLSQAIVSLLGKAKLDDNQSITTKLQSVITALAEGFCLFIGYDGSHRQKPNGNAMASKLYSSTYEIGTRWNPSWNSNSNSDSQKCATIFLACVPLFYFAMTYLHWRCTSVNGCKGDWELMCFNGEYKHDLNGSNSNPLNYFMAAVGYSDKSQLSNESGNDVMAKLKTTFNELDTTSYPESAPLYGYFLNKVEKGPTGNPFQKQVVGSTPSLSISQPH